VTEDEYRELDPSYDSVRTTVSVWKGDITVSRVQREFRFGYNRAWRMLEVLAENGHLHWDRITGKYSRPS
jgi:DNA segregation ATPase FtsK/SpoIIIE-like protein